MCQITDEGGLINTIFYFIHIRDVKSARCILSVHMNVKILQIQLVISLFQKIKTGRNKERGKHFKTVLENIDIVTEVINKKPIFREYVWEVYEIVDRPWRFSAELKPLRRNECMVIFMELARIVFEKITSECPKNEKMCDFGKFCENCEGSVRKYVLVLAFSICSEVRFQML
ncbi:hypothetical protein FF38_03144 [Lucilia cuprina]|uniref:Uncharacterized protein n=1 Tax=Lucilia cuprina TaxID=7375 RepID=A0A0L0CQK0_LUCCU|nr:hypothetical protein FF38_03144 [Lucilia cuprina]